ncbi:helix-turn-helix domain-containing protein [Streptomyces smaragdinus]|uniref:helix-turn-helix domain-containing protein n=1 Tax=Streptomyces smaragdinus TaxID=2585196 RepID=UPI001E3E728A|nr:helix-turn-helix transcriptional regulator [Streptomyces smaragdinus]
MEEPRGGPTVLRILLGTQLRRLREARGVSRDAAADVIRGSQAKISRLELGRVGYKERDVTDLLTLYGVVDPVEREEWLGLARQANSPGWWHQYSDLLPSWFEPLLGLEEAAAIIRTYQVQFVPGLLQTAEYARAVTALDRSDAAPDELQRRVDLRMRRQELITRTDGPKLWAVLDEGILRRPLGGAPVMRAQIDHLLEISELPGVTLQISPFSAGGTAAAGCPITLMRFTEPDLPDVVYLEQVASALYLDKREDVDRYQLVMDRLSTMAKPRTGSRDFLKRIRDEL